VTDGAAPPTPPPSDRLLIVLLAVITAAGPVTMNVYLPALPGVQAHFGTSVAQMNTTVSLALTAFAVGILVYGPLSDRYGREKMARMLAYLTMVTVVGPTIAPLVGGFITEAFGWQSIFALLLAASALILGFAMVAAMIYAIFLAFISIAPYVMASLGHGATEYGSWYLLVALGYFLGNWIVTRHASRIGLSRLISLGVTIQLGCAIAGATLVLAGFWHPAAIFVPMGLLGFGQGLALPNITASAVALAPRTPGSAASMLGFTQQMVGALAVQGMAAFPSGSPVPIYLFTVVVALVAWLSLIAFSRREVPAAT